MGNKKKRSQNVQKIIPQQLFQNLKKKPILTPYFLFLEEMRFKAIRDNPELSQYEIVKQASQKFWQLSPEERQIYEIRSQQITNEAEAKQYLQTLEESFLQNIQKIQIKPIRKIVNKKTNIKQ